MAFIARVNFLTTREAEPAVRFGVMAAATALWEFGAGREAEGFFLALATRRERKGGGGDAEEFDGGDGEGEFGVAFATDVGYCVSSDGCDAWWGEGCRTAGAGWDECALGSLVLSS